MAVKNKKDNVTGGVKIKTPLNFWDSNSVVIDRLIGTDILEELVVSNL
jgi:hypothetical protein